MEGTCKHGSDGVEGIQDLDVLHCCIVGHEIEAPRIGDGVRVAAGLEGVVYEESSDGAIRRDGDERVGVAVAVACGGQESGTRAVGGASPAARVRRNGGEGAYEVGAGGHAEREMKHARSHAAMRAVCSL